MLGEILKIQKKTFQTFCELECFASKRQYSTGHCYETWNQKRCILQVMGGGEGL